MLILEDKMVWVRVQFSQEHLPNRSMKGGLHLRRLHQAPWLSQSQSPQQLVSVLRDGQTSKPI
jgi:hypothetical protein